MSDIASQALKTKVDAGQLGRKSGSGFYKWDDKRPCGRGLIIRQLS